MKVGARNYESTLRTAQASATRERIIDAATTVLARGPDELSMPAVAAEAGVSVASVYRNFASKKALVDAVYERYAATIDARPEAGVPSDLHAYLSRVAAVFARHDNVPGELRAAMSGPGGQRARRRDMPARRATTAELLAPFELTDEDRERVLDLTIVLTSSATKRAFSDYLDVGPDVAADRVTWAIWRLVESSSSKSNRARRSS